MNQKNIQHRDGLVTDSIATELFDIVKDVELFEQKIVELNEREPRLVEQILQAQDLALGRLARNTRSLKSHTTRAFLIETRILAVAVACAVAQGYREAFDGLFESPTNPTENQDEE